MYPTKKLWEICEKITDWTHQTPTYVSEWVIFLSSKNVTTWKIDWENIKYINYKQHLEMSKRISPQKWDILLAKNWTTWVAAIVDKDNIFDIYVSLALLRPGKTVLVNFLWYFLNSHIAKKQFSSKIKWSGVPNLHLKEIKEVIIPLPPLSTQKLIVEKLDMIFAEIEKSKNLLEKNLQNVDEMNKSVLEKIFANDNWERKKLGEVCEIKKWKKVNYAEQWKYNYIDIGILRTNIIEQYTNDEWVFCNKNDILIAWDGSKSGTVGFWLEWVIGSTLAKITIDTKMFSSEFIGKFLQGNFDYLNKNTSGAAIPHLRKDILINLEIPLPPLSEQQKIVEYLDNIFAENQKLKNLYQAQIKNLDEMKQSFLKKAFAGELV